MKTLQEAMPREFKGYTDSRSYQWRDVEVVEEHNPWENGKRWPGPHKNVVYWVVLSNGHAVGWNENVSRGWSFPDIVYPPKNS